MRSPYQKARRWLIAKSSTGGVAAVILLFTVLGSSPSVAQVPGIINFQGRVTVSGTNFTGTGSFLFELMNGTGPGGFWGNDGGIPPTNPVLLPVTNGMFSVILGDTTLAGMVAIPSSVFSNSDVRLRVWFNGQRLDPDQRIAAAGYALMAADVAGGYVDLSSPQTISGAKLFTTNLIVQQGADDSVRWSVGVGNFTDPVSVVHPKVILFSENGVLQLAMTTNGHLYANGDIFANGTVWADGFSSGGRANVSYINAECITATNLQVNGNSFVTGTKNFVQPHPTDPTKEIVYTCLEGPEAGTYVRGSAEMVNGKAVITLPDNFGLVTSAKGLTVQVTPRRTWMELYVTTATVAQVTVGEAQGRNGSFDYLVQGVRLGYENQPVIRERKTAGAK